MSAWNWSRSRLTSGWEPSRSAAVVAVAPPDPPPAHPARPRQVTSTIVAATRPAKVRSLVVAALPRRAGRRPGKGTLRMPKSRSKRRRYQPPPRPKPKPSPPWVGPAIVVCLLLGLIYILLFYMQVLPSFLDDLGNINLAIGFVPLIVGLLLATRWT
jgi:Cell division protein CrgA